MGDWGSIHGVHWSPWFGNQAQVLPQHDFLGRWRPNYKDYSSLSLLDTYRHSGCSYPGQDIRRWCSPIGSLVMTNGTETCRTHQGNLYYYGCTRDKSPSVSSWVGQVVGFNFCLTTDDARGLVDTNTLTVGIPPDYETEVLNLINTTWHSRRRWLVLILAGALCNILVLNLR